MGDLRVRIVGEGEPVLLIHGSTGAAGDMWSEQVALADRYRLIVPDRRGYGASPPGNPGDLDVEVADIVALLGDGAHLVGFSSGGALALLAAAQRPDLTRSLSVIEPPVFGVARGHPEIDRVIAAENALYATVTRTTPEEFWQDFLQILQDDPVKPQTLSPRGRAFIARLVEERNPATIEVPLAILAAAPFPKLVLSGKEHQAFEILCDVLALRIQAERAVVEGAGHGVRHPSVTQQLAAFLASVTSGR